MTDGQDSIYYACGETEQKIEMLPQTDAVKDKGYEILYLTENVDEFALKMMNEYDGKKFINICDDNLNLDTEDEKKEPDRKIEDNKALLDFVKETVGDELFAVRISHKLVSHPVCLTSDGPITLEMEKYFALMPGENKPKAQRVLELNADHAVFASLKTAFESDKDAAEKYAKILYAQALLIAGFQLDDPAGYAEMVCSLLK